MNYPLFFEKTYAPLCMIFIAALFFPGCGKQTEKTGSTLTPADSSRVGLSASQTTTNTPDAIPVDSSAVLPAGEHPLFWIAVARSDGVLFPFAMYDKGKWTNPWPSDDFEEKYNPPDSTVVSLATVPPDWYAPLPRIPAAWHLLTPQGYVRAMTVERPAAVYEHCFQRWALVERYVPEIETTKWRRGQEKVGIALSEMQPAQKAESMPDGSGAASLLRILVEKEYNAAEKDEKRPREETTFEVVLESKGDSLSTTFYFEAKRVFPDDDTPAWEGYRNASFLVGWIHVDTIHGLTFLDVEYFPPGRGFTPKQILGVIRFAGKEFWCMRVNYYESEAYEIYEVGAEEIKLMLHVRGGGC